MARHPERVAVLGGHNEAEVLTRIRKNAPCSVPLTSSRPIPLQEGPGPAASSKSYLSGEFKISWITRASDRSECGASKRAVRIVQRRSVADVEDFRAEFKIDPLRYPKRFAD